MRRNLKVDWLQKLNEAQRDSRVPMGSWEDIYHLVILPMYDEPYEVVRESFVRLAHAHYPKEKLLVVLALEERAGEAAQRTGERIKSEFGGTFGKFIVTDASGGLCRARSRARDRTRPGRRCAQRRSLH